MKKIRIYSVFCIYNDATISYHTVQNGESIWLQNDSLSMFHVKQLICTDMSEGVRNVRRQAKPVFQAAKLCEVFRMERGLPSSFGTSR